MPLAAKLLLLLAAVLALALNSFGGGWSGLGKMHQLRTQASEGWRQNL